MSAFAFSKGQNHQTAPAIAAYRPVHLLLQLVPSNWTGNVYGRVPVSP